MTGSSATPDTAPTSADVLRRKGKSFYWAGQFLSPDQFGKAADVYQLCREIDDLVDEAVTPAQARSADQQLAALHSVLMSRLPSISEKTMFYRQAESLLGAHPLAMSALGDLVASIRNDLGTVRVADRSELLSYCYGVAGTVGVVMSCLLEASEREQAVLHAIDLGIAMQLTNISRDVLEDAHLNRVYLPADGAGGILAPKDILAGNQMARHGAWLGVRELLELAELYYRSGWQGLRYLPFRPRLAIAVAAKVYREIGQQILQKGEEHYWQGRCVVGPAQKLKVSVGALARLMLKSTSRQGARHDPGLHHGLTTSFVLHSPK
jgi:phytoene synthase